MDISNLQTIVELKNALDTINTCIELFEGDYDTAQWELLKEYIEAELTKIRDYAIQDYEYSGAKKTK